MVSYSKLSFSNFILFIAMTKLSHRIDLINKRFIFATHFQGSFSQSWGEHIVAGQGQEDPTGMRAV